MQQTRCGDVLIHDWQHNCRPENPDRRVLASTKCNLAKLPSSLGFALDSHTETGALRIGWSGPCAHTAENLLATPHDDEDRTAVQEAVEFLRSLLADGQRPTEDVKREARKAGITERTLQRAKNILGACARLVGFGSEGKWHGGASRGRKLARYRQRQPNLKGWLPLAPGGPSLGRNMRFFPGFAQRLPNPPEAAKPQRLPTVRLPLGAHTSPAPSTRLATPAKTTEKNQATPQSTTEEP